MANICFVEMKVGQLYRLKYSKLKTCEQQFVNELNGHYKLYSTVQQFDYAIKKECVSSIVINILTKIF